MVLSRWPHRLRFAAWTSLSTSVSVRCSRLRSSALGRRLGVTVRFFRITNSIQASLRSCIDRPIWGNVRCHLDVLGTSGTISSLGRWGHRGKFAADASVTPFQKFSAFFNWKLGMATLHVGTAAVNDKALLAHSFPVFGHVEIPLHSESSTIFELLKQLPMSGPSH